MKLRTILTAFVAVVALALAFSAGADPLAVPHDLILPFPADNGWNAGLALAGIGNIDLVMKQLDGIENSLAQYQEQANREIESVGKVSAETKNGLDKIGTDQRELADRLLKLEQSGVTNHDAPELTSWGKQFVNSAQYKAFQDGSTQKARFEVQNNTLVGSDANVAPDRKPGIVPGVFAPLTLESLFPTAPTSSNAIEYTKEASFTNNTAEAAEGAQKAESALTWSLVNMPISTVAHFIKISKQLAADAPALAAYVNNRMVYGVNRRVETQLAVGDGTAPNISGIFDSGNYTAHGYADAALGTVLKKLVLIRKIIADLKIAGHIPDAILVNPADLAAIDNEILTSTVTGFTGLTIDGAGVTRFRGIPFVDAVGVAADTFAVGAFSIAGTIHNRQGVIVEMSDSDGDNFQKNLVTLRAERRLALTIEQPGAIIGGDLTPA
jgi:HK97 family phage major capsid protein